MPPKKNVSCKWDWIELWTFQYSIIQSGTLSEFSRPVLVGILICELSALGILEWCADILQETGSGVTQVSQQHWHTGPYKQKGVE